MKKAVLIIDDDSRNIFALSAVLKAKGFSVLSVLGMQEAFALLKERHEEIGIILMDMMMPGMDGYEAIPHLRTAEAYRSIPVIAVTAQAMMGDREKCLAAGANDYISKPIDVEELLRIIRRKTEEV